MALPITITNAGRIALVNAANTGTSPVIIAKVGLSATAIAPTPATTALPAEIKRVVTLSGDVVADDTIHLIVRDEGADAYTVRSFALYLADGTLFAAYGQADPILEKSAQAMLLLAIDVKFEDVDATALTFGDANFLNPPATTEQMGVVELATLTELLAGADTTRVPAAKIIKDAVTSWLDSRFGANNSGIWHPGNDGSGSGLDADLLDGQHGSYYANIPDRLGYTPVQQGTGNGQNNVNVVKIGYSFGSRLKATVDITDLGNFVFDSHIADVWRASNDGSGSGLDADLLDGQHGSYYSNVTARLGFTPVRQGGGAGQGSNTVYLGWSGSRLKAQVDNVDQGNVVFDNHIADVWRASNDGSGSGLDADLLDGLQAAAFVQNSQYATRSHTVNGYQLLPSGLIIQWGAVVAPAGGINNVTFPIAFPNACLIAVTSNQSGAVPSAWSAAGNLSKTGMTIGHASSSLTPSAAGTSALWIAIGN